MPVEGVGFILNSENGSNSPDSGCRSDSREVQSTTGMSPPLSSDSPCSLCCERSHSVSQLTSCLHSFCRSCLQRIYDSQPLTGCPKCQSDLQLSDIVGSESSLSKTVSSIGGCGLLCGLCKVGDVVANCVHCVRLLCKTCLAVHDPCHVVIQLENRATCCYDLGLENDLTDKCCCKKTLGNLDAALLGKSSRLLDFSWSLRDVLVSRNGANHEFCLDHKSEPVVCFCKTCRRMVCSICTVQGSCIEHEYATISDIIKMLDDSLIFLAEQAKTKINDVLSVSESLDSVILRLKEHYEESMANISKTFNFFTEVLQDLRDEMSFELKSVHSTKMGSLSNTKVDLVNMLTDLREVNLLMNALIPMPSVLSLIPMKQNIVDRVNRLLEYKPEIDGSGVEFVSNHQAIQIAVRNTFGYIRHDQKDAETATKKFARTDFATPFGSLCGDNSPFVNSFSSSGTTVLENCGILSQGLPFAPPKPRIIANDVECQNRSDLKQLRGSSKSLATHPGVPQTVRASRKSSGSGANRTFDCSMKLSLPSLNPLSGSSAGRVENDGESVLKAIVSDACPILLTRAKMEYHCKFGEYGSESSQFTEPSGVAVNSANEILVADANNHRIQIFDKNGIFKCIIGQDGRGEGDLVYPNRLAINMRTGDIFVTERSPTHQVQVYNQHGRFIRRFGAHILQHPRGITVDKLGRVIVVECKVMRVVIFSCSGSIISRFVIDKHVNFPNGVAVNDAEEIFISDNRRHGIVVFSYQGRFLRTIGGTGVTNYPIGVGINSVGEVVVADNHNNFNVTVFGQDGRFIRAMESRVKHAQCFDIALMGDSSIVLSSKDFRIYLYKYVQSCAFQDTRNKFI